MVSEDDTVCIDPSTTCSFLAEYLPDLPVHAVTPSIDTFLSLAQKNNIQAILSGGRLNKNTQNLVGRAARKIIREFYFSICFISADGFDMERGSLEFDYEDSAVKRAMIEVSDKIVLLINSAKLNRTKGIVTCEKRGVHRIITDSGGEIDWPEDLIDKVCIVEG